MGSSKGRISVGVGAVVMNDEGQILLPVERDFWGGKWMVPRGELELGETLEEGVAREVEEETNLRVKVLRHISTLDRVVREGDKVKLHVVYVDFLAAPVGGELRPGSDVEGAQWFSKADLRAHREEIHVDTKRLLAKVGFLEG